MKTIRIFLMLCLCMMLCACTGTEPNDVAYVVAMGFDKADNDNYMITIQFARPTQISGGASEEGGKSGSEIVENIVLEAPDVYSALGLANHIVSKKFTLAHAKLMVFSAEVAKDGIEDIMETVARNEEIRPDIYLSVARNTAREYLFSVKPIIEVNPAKYYQLVYENNDSLGVVQNTAIDFYFNARSKNHENAVPIAGEVRDSSQNEKSVLEDDKTAPIEKIEGEASKSGQGSQGGQGGQGAQGGQNGQSSQGGQGGQSSQSGDEEKPEESENKEQKKAPITDGGFEFKLRDYIAGQIGINEKNKSETMGMAVFDGYKAKIIAGSIETEIYNILRGEFNNVYLTLRSDTDKPITVKATKDKAPQIKVDVKNKKIDINLFLESDLYSMSEEFMSDTEVMEFEKMATSEIEAACNKFIDEVIKKNRVDLLGFKKAAKSKFLTNREFNKEKDKILDYKMHVSARFYIRRTGLSIRGAEE